MFEAVLAPSTLKPSSADPSLPAGASQGRNRRCQEVKWFCHWQTSGSSGNEFWFHLLAFETRQPLECAVPCNLTNRLVSQNRGTTSRPSQAKLPQKGSGLALSQTRDLQNKQQQEGKKSPTVATFLVGSNKFL